MREHRCQTKLVRASPAPIFARMHKPTLAFLQVVHVSHLEAVLGVVERERRRHKVGIECPTMCIIAVHGQTPPSPLLTLLALGWPAGV